MTENLCAENEIYRADLFSTQDEVRLVGGRCMECGKVSFPRYALCTACSSEKVEPSLLSPQGTLHSYTTVRRSMPGRAVPYVLGLIDLPEGVRVLGQIEVDDAKPLQLNARMQTIVGPIDKKPDGGWVMSFKFRPAA